MKIAVAYANTLKKYWLKFDVPEPCTVAQGLEHSGILDMCPEIKLQNHKIGVFGKVVKLDASLRPGDRIEIYRPIVCDPTKVPRKNVVDDDE